MVRMASASELQEIAIAEYEAAARLADRVHRAMRSGDESALAALTHDELMCAAAFRAGKVEHERSRRRLALEIERRIRGNKGKTLTVPAAAVVACWRAVCLEPLWMSVRSIDQEVARRLGVSEKTVRNRRTALGLKGLRLQRVMANLREQGR